MEIINTELTVICEHLLGRPLTAEDGISLVEILKAEELLEVELPCALKHFYKTVGNVMVLTQSFNAIVRPEELALYEGYLVFAEENQGVCVWGVDLSSEKVYQYSDGEWFSEEADLGAFLALMVCYNCAQGGYEHAGILSWTPDASVPDGTWEKYIEYNGLVLYGKDDNLIWWLMDAEGAAVDDCIYLSSRTEESYERYASQYGFKVL